MLLSMFGESVQKSKLQFCHILADSEASSDGESKSARNFVSALIVQKSQLIVTSCFSCCRRADQQIPSGPSFQSIPASIQNFVPKHIRLITYASLAVSFFCLNGWRAYRPLHLQHRCLLLRLPHCESQCPSRNPQKNTHCKAVVSQSIK